MRESMSHQYLSPALKFKLNVLYDFPEKVNLFVVNPHRHIKKIKKNIKSKSISGQLIPKL